MSRTVDLDLMLFDFAAAYAEDRDAALHDLQFLLLDEHAFEQRMMLLRELERRAAGKYPPLPDERVTELLRIAGDAGCYGPVIALETGLISVDDLDAVTRHPQALEHMRRKFLSAEPADCPPPPAPPKPASPPQQPSGGSLVWPLRQLAARDAGPRLSGDSVVVIPDADSELRFVLHRHEAALLDVEHKAWPAAVLVRIRLWTTQSGVVFEALRVTRAGYRQNVVVRNVGVPCDRADGLEVTQVPESELSDDDIAMLWENFQAACQEDPAAFQSWKRWARNAAQHEVHDRRRDVLNQITQDVPPPRSGGDTVIAHGRGLASAPFFPEGDCRVLRATSFRR